MPFFPSLPDDASPANLFTAFPDLFRPWSEMSELLMNGPSPLSQGERELLASFVAGVADCRFVRVAHTEVAHAWGVEEGLVDAAIDDLAGAPLEPRLAALLGFVRALVLRPAELTRDDVDPVFEAGWDERALHDAIFITARIRFMQCLVEGHGLVPMTEAKAKERAAKRVELGYVGLYPELADRRTRDET